MARLRVETGKSQGKNVDVEKTAVIGRGEATQLQINDLKASREHCKVFEQAGTWSVADLNSRNGIKVNGVQTTRKTLSHGDRIEIGETVIVFETAGTAAAASRAASAADTAESMAPAKDAPKAPAGKPAAPAAKPAAAAAKPAAPARPAPLVKGGAAGKKAVAMAEARAAAAKKAAGAKGAPAARPAASATKAAGTGKGLEVSDHVLQFHKVDSKKATVLDIDLAQSPGVTKVLILVACVAFVVVTIWFVASMLGER